MKIDDREIVVDQSIVGFEFDDFFVMSFGIRETVSCKIQVPQIEMGIQMVWFDRHSL